MSEAEKTYLEILQEKIQKENSRKIDKETFQKLLDAGDLGQIMSEGGLNLTKKQLRLVKEKAKEQSEEKILSKQLEIASQPGYAESILIPLKRKILEESFGVEPDKISDVTPPEKSIVDTETFKIAKEFKEKLSPSTIKKALSENKGEVSGVKTKKPSFFSSLMKSSSVQKELTPDTELGESPEDFSRLFKKISEQKQNYLLERQNFEIKKQEEEEKRHKKIMSIFSDATKANKKANKENEDLLEKEENETNKRKVEDSKEEKLSSETKVPGTMGSNKPPTAPTPTTKKETKTKSKRPKSVRIKKQKKASRRSFLSRLIGKKGFRAKQKRMQPLTTTQTSLGLLSLGLVPLMASKPSQSAVPMSGTTGGTTPGPSAVSIGDLDTTQQYGYLSSEQLSTVISKHEGNANSVYGDYRDGNQIKNVYGNRPEDWSEQNLGTRKKLTEFTFAELRSYQIFRNSVKESTGAVGIAGFMPTTIFGKDMSGKGGLFASSGFSMNDKFTEENQKILQKVLFKQQDVILKPGLEKLGINQITPGIKLAANYVGAGGLLAVIEEGQKDPNITVKGALMKRFPENGDPTRGNTINKDLGTTLAKDFVQAKERWIIEKAATLGFVNKKDQQVSSLSLDKNNTVDNKVGEKIASVSQEIADKKKTMMAQTNNPIIIVSNQVNNNKNVSRSISEPAKYMHPILEA